MEQENKTPNKIVQTYAEDMAGVLAGGEGSMIKKIIHSEEEEERRKKNLSPESKKNKFFMIMGMVFILAALGVLLFLLFKKGPSKVPVEKQFTPLVFIDTESVLEVAGLKKDAIAEKVNEAVTGTKVKAGGVEGIYLTLDKTPVGLRKFVELIGGNFNPGNNTLVYDSFLMGVVKSSGQAAPNGFFILLKMRSIPDIFDAMRSWEGKMFSDLHGFAGTAIAPETKYLLGKNFEDGVVENKNARILYDHEGNAVLMYVFADDNSVVISNTRDAVREIMIRLAVSQVGK